MTYFYKINSILEWSAIAEKTTKSGQSGIDWGYVESFGDAISERASGNEAGSDALGEMSIVN